MTASVPSPAGEAASTSSIAWSRAVSVKCAETSASPKSGSSRSDIEEYRFVRSPPLKHDVKLKPAVSDALGDQCRPAMRRHLPQHRICIVRGLTLEVDSGEQTGEHAA